MQNFMLIMGLIVVGWLAGAFVNYCSDVLPWKRRLAGPLCVYCQADIAWLNYWLWPRRCLACGLRRPWRVWVVELVYVLAAFGMWQVPHPYLGFWIGLGVLVYFGVVVIIDIEYRLILHQVSFVGAVLLGLVGILWRAQSYNGQPGLLFTSFSPWWYGLWTTVLGGALGFGFMWVMYALGEVFIRFVSRRRGKPVDDVALGFGDVNLAGVLGLLLGWPLIVVGLFLGILIGGLVSLLFLVGMLLIRRYHLLMALPYGPFLVGGAVFVIYLRDLLIQMLQ